MKQSESHKTIHSEREPPINCKITRKFTSTDNLIILGILARSACAAMHKSKSCCRAKDERARACWPPPCSLWCGVAIPVSVLVVGLDSCRPAGPVNEIEETD